METEKSRTFPRTPSSWDPQDDLLLRRLKEQQKLGWKEISSHFNNRTPNACQFRWRRLRSGSLKSSSTASLPQAAMEEAKLQIQPKTLRRHSLLSSSSNNTTPIISSSSRSGSFTDLQSTNSISSTESQNLSSLNLNLNLKQRQRSYSTTSTSNSLFFTQSDDPLSQPITNQYSNIPQHHLSNNLNHHHHLNPHHLVQKQPYPHHFVQPTAPIPSHQVSPQQPQQQQQQQQQQSHHHQQAAASAQSWEEDEDDLLLSRRERELSFTELSILLPSKSEMDIWLRIEYLETNRKNSLPQLSRSLSISSSISNQSLTNLPVLKSRENSISMMVNADTLPVPAAHLHSNSQQQQQFAVPVATIKEEKEFTKKRSIKLPSLGSILNNF